MEFFDSAVSDGSSRDAPACPECEFDFDCPQPPPFGCGQGVCVAGVCTIGTGSCEAGEACDQDELLCTPERVELRARLRTDYEVFRDFDRVVVEVDGRVVFQDTFLDGDPLLGLELGVVFVGDREELQIEVTIFLGCDEVNTRMLSLTPDGDALSPVLVMSRDMRP
ncbi:MAG: hypothetical protein ACI9KE_006760 [Polyangiales bacterium]|jgi:hypothetical protein